MSTPIPSTNKPTIHELKTISEKIEELYKRRKKLSQPMNNAKFYFDYNGEHHELKGIDNNLLKGYYQKIIEEELEVLSDILKDKYGVNVLVIEELMSSIEPNELDARWNK